MNKGIQQRADCYRAYLIFLEKTTIYTLTVQEIKDASTKWSSELHESMKDALVEFYKGLKLTK